jgi:GDP-L-fucose synthase
VWGDGSPVRDFLHARDVAQGMMVAMKEMPNKPINLGSGVGTSIKDVVDIVVKNVNPRLKIKWDTSKPSGDKKRIMDISRAKSLGWEPKISLEEGIRETIEWYKENR